MKGTRIFSAALAALLLLSTLLACGEAGSNEATTTTASETTTAASITESTPAETEITEPNVPTPDFGGEEVTILTWKHSIPEFNVEAETGDLIKDAVFLREQTTEDRLHVEISAIEKAGDWNNRNAFINDVTQSVNAGDGAYDLVAHYSLAASLGTMKNLYLNLHEVPHIDFTQPWWPGDIVDATSIGNKVYFTTGDVAPSVLRNIFGIYFNDDLIKQNGFESPYDLVEGGKWTFEKLRQMSLGQYQDLNNNQEADIGDRFGFVFTDIVHVDPFFYAAGLTIVGKDGNGNYVLSEKFNSEQTATWLTTLCSYLHDNNDVIVQPSGTPIFHSGQSLFMVGTLNMATTSLRDVDFTYGMVPLPKYDEEQDRHYSVVGMTYSMMTVPIDVKNVECSGAVLESLACEGYRQVSPAIFETAFKIKYSETEQAAKMYDIVRETLVYDVGRTFGDTINAFALFRNAVRDNNNNWASRYASSYKGYEIMIKKIVQTLG